jgi:pilus assembly protein CpaB
MNRVRIFSVFLIALIAGGGLAYGTYDYLQNVPVKTVTVPTRRVVVANADLSLGSELRRDDLKAVDWPVSAVPEGAFEDPAALLGRGLIASVVRHEPILPGKLASKEAGSGLPPIIPSGKRAMSVRVNEVIGVAGYVLPGTRVDVVATQSPTNRGEDMTSKVVLSNVEVLTAGTRLEHDS